MTSALFPHVRLRALFLALALATLCTLGSAGAAHAGRGQTTILQDDTLLLNRDAATRESTLDEWKALGVDTVKLNVRWRQLAPSPGSEDKPAIDATDPGAYDQNRFATFDAAIASAQRRGMNVMLMIVGGGPDWAAGANREDTQAGIQRPDAGEFKLFVQAVGTRYSGSYQGLPRVTTFSIWNEPNLLSWLGPQYRGSTPYAPRLYRDLLYAGEEGLEASGHTDGELLMGELAPYAGVKTGSGKIRPLTFLRELACVDSKYRPYKGSAAAKRGCTDFRPLPGTGLAYHPYTLAGGPAIKSRNRDDATISELPRLTSTLDKLTKKKRFALSAKMPIWSTEFGYQTDPPDPVQSPIKDVPGFMGFAEWYAWKNKRVVSYSQYPFQDDAIPNDNSPGRFGGFQSGIKFESGRKKPGVFNAFQFPFFVRVRSASSVEVFGATRAAGSGAEVTIQSRVGRAKFKPVKGGTITTGAQGYFDKVLKVSSSRKRDFRFVTGESKSNTIQPVKP